MDVQKLFRNQLLHKQIVNLSPLNQMISNSSIHKQNFMARGAIWFSNTAVGPFKSAVSAADVEKQDKNNPLCDEKSGEKADNFTNWDSSTRVSTNNNTAPSPGISTSSEIPP